MSSRSSSDEAEMAPTLPPPPPLEGEAAASEAPEEPLFPQQALLALNGKLNQAQWTVPVHQGGALDLCMRAFHRMYLEGECLAVVGLRQLRPPNNLPLCPPRFAARQRRPRPLFVLA